MRSFVQELETFGYGFGLQFCAQEEGCARIYCKRELGL